MKRKRNKLSRADRRADYWNREWKKANILANALLAMLDREERKKYRWQFKYHLAKRKAEKKKKK